MSLRLYVGVAKLPRFGVSVSGDSVDLVERPRGGLSLIVADGPGNGGAAKRVSSMVVARTGALLAEGVRDGAAARSAHDLLFASREGRVSCALTIASADVAEQALVVTRSGDAPAFACQADEVTTTRHTTRLADDVTPLGFGRFSRPSVTVLPLCAGTLLLAGSDGMLAPERLGSAVGLEDRLVALVERTPPRAARTLAAEVMHAVLTATAGRPRDDVTVVVMGVDTDEERLSAGAGQGERAAGKGVASIPSPGPPGEQSRMLTLELEMPLGLSADHGSRRGPT